VVFFLMAVAMAMGVVAVAAATFFWPYMPDPAICALRSHLFAVGAGYGADQYLKAQGKARAERRT
jgi:hypothetical protein